MKAKGTDCDARRWSVFGQTQKAHYILECVETTVAGKLMGRCFGLHPNEDYRPYLLDGSMWFKDGECADPPTSGDTLWCHYDIKSETAIERRK